MARFDSGDARYCSERLENQLKKEERYRIANFGIRQAV
jgi:hypothetical protein